MKSLARVVWLGAIAAIVLLFVLERHRPVSDAAARPVTSERLRAAEADPSNWLTYSGQYNGQRYSRLSSITRRTARRLQVKWIYQLHTTETVETTPLVVDGVMYLTRANDVIALDASSGRPYWTYTHAVSPKARLCCGRQNRGLAILDGRLFMATLDAELLAIDAASGTLIWRTQIADPADGYSSTGAPLVVKDKVITGIAGGEYGIRGFVDAYDAATGARAWRFYTVPAVDEPGNETWAGDSWQTGGGPTWTTGSYDPALNLVYWGVGNPGPDWNGAERGGDNLYTDSVVALDADSGALRWYFQFTPHDEYDWDATQVPVLADTVVGGRTVPLLYFANRNAFFYVLNRATGAFVRARAFARQTWADRIDERGRPVRRAGVSPTPGGVVVAPPSSGATNWWSPAFSPATGWLYVTAYDGAGSFYAGEPTFTPGTMYLGSGAADEEPNGEGRSAIRAIDPATGERMWEFQVHPRSMSGLLASAGGLVFGGSIDGYVFALDAQTGADLWHRNVGGSVNTGPIMYAVNGVDYLVVVAGDAVVAFVLD
jgi:alcohol dehydrogenase (cytochrome c)